MSEEFPVGLQDWQGDGVLATAATDSMRRELRRRKLPVIDLSNEKSDSPFPRVLADDAGIGRLAAEHFLDRGYRHFGFYGLPDDNYSNLRMEGFRKRLAEEDIEVHVNRTESLGQTEDWRWWRDISEQWIRSVPRPIGVLACNDNQGRTLTSVCNRSGLRVPEDVSILGVDNDEVMCELCNPPMSSIEKADDTRGYEAAALLEKLMRGKSPPPGPLTIPPRKIVSRQSTDLLAVDDPDVADAVRFIRQHAHEPILVKNVLQEVPISRRSLEKRFLEILGRLPGEEIRRVHVARAKTLLAESDLPLAEVARRSGLRTAKSLSDIFRRHVGITPSEYRQQHLIR
jgi:LacI family transcriptional regulator